MVSVVITALTMTFLLWLTPDSKLDFLLPGGDAQCDLNEGIRKGCACPCACAT